MDANDPSLRYFTNYLVSTGNHLDDAIWQQVAIASETKDYAILDAVNSLRRRQNAVNTYFTVWKTVCESNDNPIRALHYMEAAIASGNIPIFPSPEGIAISLNVYKYIREITRALN